MPHTTDSSHQIKHEIMGLSSMLKLSKVRRNPRQGQLREDNLVKHIETDTEKSYYTLNRGSNTQLASNTVNPINDNKSLKPFVDTLNFKVDGSSSNYRGMSVTSLTDGLYNPIRNSSVVGFGYRVHPQHILQNIYIEQIILTDPDGDELGLSKVYRDNGTGIATTEPFVKYNILYASGKYKKYGNFQGASKKGTDTFQATVSKSYHTATIYYENDDDYANDDDYGDYRTKLRILSSIPTNTKLIRNIVFE